ncbi:hypothetical protein BA059_16695 [Mycolicibacterium sp. (ex Dasyatis americana)]|nr:hypothetical protein BA059_16695 [Mycolicibacterium sp. (ex Dasyatis americana)]
MTNITAHNDKWGDLPLFPEGRWVASDEDTAHWSDLMYLRAIADDLEDRGGLVDLGVSVELEAALAELRTDEPDRAAELLKAWRYDEWPDESEPIPAEQPKRRWWRRTVHKRTARRLFAALAVAALVIVGIGYATAPAKAAPGQCVSTPFGGFCDGPMLPGGIYHHCEGALGFGQCFYVRAVPVEVDPRGWVPA